MYVPDEEVLNTSSDANGIICSVYQETTATQIIKTLVYILIIGLSLTGNTIVMLTVLRNRHMKSVTNFFIANLAASDLLITFLGMPNMITQAYLSDRWIFGPVICKLVVYLQSVSVASSVLTLLAITKDRFVAIVFPFHPRMGFGTAKIILAIIWFIALGVMAPLIYSARTAKHNIQGYDTCIEDWSPAFNKNSAPKDFTVVLFVTLYMVPLITMAILYSVIAKKLWRRQKFGEQIITSDIRRIQAGRKKVIKMLVTVIILFAACWLPLYVYQFILFFAYPPCFDSNSVFYFLSLFLSHANSAINPYLYALFNKNYRDGFKTVCTCAMHQNEPLQRVRDMTKIQKPEASLYKTQNGTKNTKKRDAVSKYRPDVLSFGSAGRYALNEPGTRKGIQERGMAGVSFIRGEIHGLGD